MSRFLMTLSLVGELLTIMAALVSAVRMTTASSLTTGGVATLSGDSHARVAELIPYWGRLAQNLKNLVLFKISFSTF